MFEIVCDFMGGSVWFCFFRVSGYKATKLQSYKATQEFVLVWGSTENEVRMHAWDFFFFLCASTDCKK